MRGFVAVMTTMLIVSGTAVPSVSRADPGKPERSLSCTRGGEPFCDVSCVSVDGQSLFVFDHVQTVFVTEFAGHHTLLEIQRSVGDTVSVLVGDISHCTLNGLQDPSLERGKG